jgi:hypothetical protein
MKTYIATAREGNAKMREILSNVYLKDSKNEYGNPYKGKRGRSFGSLSLACEEYCTRYWNASAADVVYNRTNESDDGDID